MDSLQTRITDELRRIIPVIEEYTGLTSRWSGIVELVSDADFKGKKPFRCDILIDVEWAKQDVHWTTLIHEALHSVSAGYNPTDFQRNRGWEEGVVERMQRFLRPVIFARLGVDLPVEIFTTHDNQHAFNGYIALLEEVRVALVEEDAEAFYRHLLQTPIRDRYSLLLDIGRSLPQERKTQALFALSRANAEFRNPSYVQF
jgi:hypothetical protein